MVDFFAIFDKSVHVEIFVNDVYINLFSKIASLEIIDEDGTKSDRLTLKVDNSFLRPKYKDEIKVYINYKFYGLYSVVETIKDEKFLTIKADSINFNESLKEKKSRSFEKMKLCSLIEKIAKEHNLKAKCNYKHFIKHIAQDNESDINLLNRLAKEHNCICNIKNNTILFLNKSDTKDLPVFIVSLSECESYSIKHSAKPLYKSAVAKYHDTKHNKIKKVKVGSGSPEFVFVESFKSEAEARVKAENYLKMLEQNTITGRLSIYGQEIRAGGVLELTGVNEDAGEYKITKVTHKIGNKYIVEVEFKK